MHTLMWNVPGHAYILDHVEQAFGVYVDVYMQTYTQPCLYKYMHTCLFVQT